VVVWYLNIVVGVDEPDVNENVRAKNDSVVTLAVLCR